MYLPIRLFYAIYQGVFYKEIPKLEITFGPLLGFWPPPQEF